jgi:hypothetical protein
VYGIEDAAKRIDPLVELNKSLAHFDTYRDCSCGIIGYKEADPPKIDEDGEPIYIPIHSPCDLHKPMNPTEDRSHMDANER